MVLACRRAGKTQAAATRTLAHCLSKPDRTAMVFSPTKRQSQEFARTVRNVDKAIGMPFKRVSENSSEVEWENGSRLMSMPDRQTGVVGFTPSLIVIDEASRVSDLLYMSVRPMLALGAELIVTSTPFGKRGWFFDIWDSAGRGAKDRLKKFAWWKITAEDCPRITAEFLEEELAEIGPRWFKQEWLCDFSDTVGSVFSKSVIDRAFSGDFEPLFGPSDRPSDNKPTAFTRRCAPLSGV
jgi:hypothetical protein